MLEAVIFDMDGVLVDSEGFHYLATKEMMARKFSVTFDYEYYKQYIGGTVPNMWNGLMKDFGLSHIGMDVLNEYCDEVLQEMLDETGYPAVEGVVRFVKMLKDEYHLKLAVASSSGVQRIMKNLTNLGLADYFDAIVSGQEIGKSKPDPGVFYEASKNMGVSTKNCMVIEDSMNGVLGAKNAGMVCLGYINPNSGNQDLSRADALFESFNNLDYNYVKMIYGHGVGEPVTVIETDRLIIREITTKDVDRLYEIYDEDVSRYIPSLFANKEDEIKYTKDYIDSVYKFYHYGIWVVCLKESGEIIGRAGVEYKEIEETDIVHELGYVISSEYQRCGYAKEAVSAIINYMSVNYDVRRFFVEVHKDNEPSMKFSKSLGCVFDGKVSKAGYCVGILEIE